MTQAHRFFKIHGLGNDFTLFDWVDQTEPFPLEKVPLLCDRAFGVGGDGVVLVLPGETTDYRMRIYNADGSLAEMCGNAIRCFAKYLREQRGVRQSPLPIETDAGVLSCEFSGDHYTIEMGAPILARSVIPIAGEGSNLDIVVSARDREFVGHGVSMGNPHFVIFGIFERDEIETYGPTLMTHPLFPRRTNVEFAHLRSRDEIDLTVYERGVGITLACGTGACATAVAACLKGLADPDSAISVNLPGGRLTIRVAPDYTSVWMTGPATIVFEGMIDLDQLA